MSNKATILFDNDALLTDHTSLKQFVENSTNTVNTLFHDGELIVVVKLKKKPSDEDFRMAAGTIARELSKRKVESASISGEKLTAGFQSLEKGSVVTAFVEGWNLGSYQFLEYKSGKKPFKTELHVDGDETIQDFVETGKIRAAATAFSRDLMNEIPSTLNPTTFPSILKESFQDTDVKISVYDKDELERRQMNGVLTVGRGSTHSPAFVELNYRKDESKPLVALVGKGVTFDTGGITLKRGKDLSSMRMDMGGAAAVAGAMKLLADSKADVNVVALIPIAENMPDSTSIIPGDVITYKNGLNVQVGNTDAEGRLILADALIRAGELNSEYVIDIATLTGAIVNALGTQLAGVFGDEQLAREMKEIGDINGDYVWPMPLVDAYDSYLSSDYADFNNTSSKAEAGSITAGLFLRRFVPESCKWLHVDMAGVMQSAEKGYYAKSATGFGARLLADFTKHISK
ncbi:leucyl aminopeptidase family protein [Oceanobacillus luteolus]|uniref:Probable cytosol aminopeptidase n=1 Tax=Oceanobacillus luteolus TaxID=1274358 RepID=A0ABW4HTM3_9BACI|nr:leucyl aminopeptidase family protein [Oceanobacillus luteolus]MCM3741929.1 leucyl aminopeptidase family protein [Oceanobacillus luteolus]